MKSTALGVRLSQSNPRHTTYYLWGPGQGTSEKAMAPHSSTLAWKSPWTEEPGGLQSTVLSHSKAEMTSLVQVTK